MSNVEKSLPKNLLMMGILIIITFSFLFKGVNLPELFSIMKSAHLGYLMAGLLLMFGFVTCEALNTQTLLKIHGHQLKLTQTLKYAFTGFFFCAVTPSATGGQPMQVYLMKKDNVDVHQSSLTLLVELACFQFATVVIALFSLLTQYQYVMSGEFLDVTIIITGLVSNVLIMLFVVFAIMSRRFSAMMLKLVNAIIDFVPFIKQKEALKETMTYQFEEYAKGYDLLKQHKKLFIKVLATTFLQVLSQYFVSYFVYKSLGLSEMSIWYVISMQSLVSTAVSALPLPGGIGASEKIFLFLFSTVYPVHLLMSGLLLTRGISFYVFVLISGVMMSASHFKVPGFKERSNSTPTY